MPVNSVEPVRQAVSDQLAKLSNQGDVSLYETILIRNGLYCGRKFHWQGYEVVWLLDQSEIRFFGPCSDLLLSTPIAELMRLRWNLEGGHSANATRKAA